MKMSFEMLLALIKTRLYDVAVFEMSCGIFEKERNDVAVLMVYAFFGLPRPRPDAAWKRVNNLSHRHSCRMTAISAQSR